MDRYKPKRGNCKILTKHCNEIASGSTIEHDGHKFDSVDEYLTHWRESVDHKFIPIKQINHELQKLDELQKELDYDLEGPKL